MIKLNAEKPIITNEGKENDPLYEKQLQEAEILVKRYADMIRDNFTEAKIDKIIPFLFEELEKISTNYIGIKFLHDLKIRTNSRDRITLNIIDHLYAKNHKTLGKKGVTNFKGHFSVPNQISPK